MRGNQCTPSTMKYCVQVTSLGSFLQHLRGAGDGNLIYNNTCLTRYVPFITHGETMKEKVWSGKV